MPRRKRTLEELLPTKADRDKFEELLYMVESEAKREASLGPKGRSIRKAIQELSKAPETLRFLRLNWVGQAAQIQLDCGESVPGLGSTQIKLEVLEQHLRRACLAFEKARVTMQKAKRPFLDNAIARFVALLWELTGQPRHELAEGHLSKILGPRYAHKRWCERHRQLIGWHRGKARQFGLYSHLSEPQTPRQ